MTTPMYHTQELTNFVTIIIQDDSNYMTVPYAVFVWSSNISWTGLILTPGVSYTGPVLKTGSCNFCSGNILYLWILFWVISKHTSDVTITDTIAVITIPMVTPIMPTWRIWSSLYWMVLLLCLPVCNCMSLACSVPVGINTSQTWSINQ